MISLDPDPEGIIMQRVLKMNFFERKLSSIKSLILKLIGVKGYDLYNLPSEEAIKSLINQSKNDGLIEEEEKDMICKVFDFNDKMAKEIMTSRSDTFLINIEDDFKSILPEILKYNFSRIPVYKENTDNIIGILYVKDLLAEASKVGFDNITLEKILQKPYFVPEIKPINELFKLLKEAKIHLAVLFDEYGGFSGIVTMEDLVEEVMGDIEDEYDQGEDISQINEDTFIVKGNLSVNDFNDRFDLSLKEGDYDTLNGYLTESLGKIPKENEVVELENVKFTVVKVKNRRVEEVKVNLLKIEDKI